MKQKCSYCNHLDDYHHDYCPIDERELKIWNQGYSDGLAEESYKQYKEASHNKIYELGYYCGESDLFNKCPDKDLMVAEMLGILQLTT